MYIPELCLKSLLVSAGLGLGPGSNNPQIPVERTTLSLADYEFTGPGTYRIISTLSSLAVSADPSNPAGMVSAPVIDDDNAQRWVVADTGMGSKRYMIFNNGTGAALSANKGADLYWRTAAVATPPYDTLAHWTFDSVDATGKPVVMTNIGRSGRVLDLRGSERPAGTPIISYPPNKPVTPNQRWYFQYLG
ncbi:MAG: hypothetical protein Q9216_005601 [Gyalolechia sp. 2 TL-2023]